MHKKDIPEMIQESTPGARQSPGCGFLNRYILDIPPTLPHLKGYRIVFERQGINLPLAELKCFHELHEGVLQTPKKYLKSLEEFFKRFPDIPEVANLLAYSWLKVRKKSEAEALIEKTWRNHPDYLIGRINHAEMALEKNRLEQIPVIFNGCFELNALYPARESFHYTEFRGFMTLMGFYHLRINQRDRAEGYYQLAFQVDPLHSSVSLLEKQLSKTSFTKKCVGALQKLALICKKH